MTTERGNGVAQGAADFATDAEDSAAAAAASEIAAALSETNAAASAAAALVSETNAATSETNAATSESNASTSETNAGISETNAAASESAAAASATAAANSAASLIWNDVEFKTFSDTPISITDSQRGVLLAVDTSGGNVVINLAAVSTLTMPFTLGIKKTTSDGNTITVNRGGTDTIDGGTSFVIQGNNNGATLLADTDPTPDEWTALQFGPGAGNYTVDNFTDVTDYTSGTTTQLTLSLAPGSENNLDVQFDGVTQHHTEYSVSGTTLTFSSAIPLGTNNIEVKIGTALSVGTPSDGTVTAAKMDSGDVVAIRDLLNVDDKWNHIINGNFKYWQRGSSGSTTGKYYADRWMLNLSGGVGTVTRTAFTIGQTDVPHEPQYYAALNITTGDNNCSLMQRIEGARTLAGRTVSISFYAKGTNSGDGHLSVGANQAFGTGGSPSSQVDITVGDFVLTSSWQRFKFTVTLPSISGKTFGTDGNDYLQILIGQPGDDVTTSAWNIDIANVAVFEGDTDQDFVPRPDAVELALCQRYYETSYPVYEDVFPGDIHNSDFVNTFINGLSSAAHGASQHIVFATPKRTASSTLTLYSPVTGASGKLYDSTTAADLTASATSLSGAGASWYGTQGSAQTTFNFRTHWAVAAEL